MDLTGGLAHRPNLAARHRSDSRHIRRRSLPDPRVSSHPARAAAADRAQFIQRGSSYPVVFTESKEPIMLLQILAHTPKWVFFLFAGLLWLGINQMFSRDARLGRVLGIAIGMVALSLYGTIAAFGGSEHSLVLALGAWIATASATVGWLLSQEVPAGTHYDAANRRLTLPGSIVPLALMMGIFFAKYGVAVATVLHPQLPANATFALVCGALYGAFSGGFAGRAARLMRLALAPQKGATKQPVSA
ncbi:MAG: DUF6622 family protein [Burkholderiales bacterium]